MEEINSLRGRIAMHRFCEEIEPKLPKNRKKRVAKLKNNAWNSKNIDLPDINAMESPLVKEPMKEKEKKGLVRSPVTDFFIEIETPVGPTVYKVVNFGVQRFASLWKNEIGTIKISRQILQDKMGIETSIMQPEVLAALRSTISDELIDERMNGDLSSLYDISVKPSITNRN